MTQPAPQPPAGPPPQPPAPQGQAGQQPPPAAPPAPPAPPAQPPQQPQQGQAYPYGIPPQTPPQQPTPQAWTPPPTGWQPPAYPGWTPPAPGQPLAQPYPAPTGQPTPPPDPGQGPPAPPNPPDNDGSSYDLSRLPRGAREEIERLRGQVTQRDTQLRTATVSQHAWAAAGQAGLNPAALVGSTAWQQAAAGLDPATPDYAQRLVWTIQSIAAQAPWIATQPAPPAQPPPAAPPTSGGDFAAGNGAGQPISEAQLAHMTPAQIKQAYDEGKLKHLM